MNKLLLVFVGGGFGAVARYGFGEGALRALGPAWPYGTLGVNLIGGALMGILAGWLAQRGGTAQQSWQLLLGVGLLGGFTTFSAFSLDTARMLEARAYGPAATYALASVVLSVAALFAGLALARRLFA